MKTIILITILFFVLPVAYTQTAACKDFVIARGQMPNITRDKNDNIRIVYGKGDSIMYVSTRDGISFTEPSLVALLPGLFASAMRGPQIASAADGIVVTACTHNGDIFSYKKEASNKWGKPVRVNDINGVAKEALLAISADGLNVYAIWLGVKSPKGQDVYGARSVNGGRTWGKNILIYASPDSTVCECCKPAIAENGNNVYVMFRNWLNGNRDLFLIKSSNGGRSFGKAEKLGTGSWKLNGCPMDGGGLTIDKNGSPQTVWRREGKIYAATPGMPEKEIGEGHSCSMETINSTSVYVWTEKGDVIIHKMSGMKINLGKGSLPLVKAIDSKKLICVWENENEIHASVINL